MRGRLISLGSATGKIPRISSLRNESLYGVWTAHGIFHNFEFGKNGPLSTALMQRPIFGRLTEPKSQLEVIAKALGMSVAKVSKLKGLDIIGDSPDMRIFHQGLRFCQKCLNLGYHSILYQHVGLALCPIHLTPLEHACPNCKKVIIPTYSNAIAHPFECPHCIVSLARTIYKPNDLQVAKLADQMVEGRRSVLVKSNAFAKNKLYFDDASHIETSSATAVARHYQRATVWAEPGDPQWINFPEEKLTTYRDLYFKENNCAESFDIGLAAERVIIKLFRACDGHVQVALRLAQRLGRYPRGLRLNAHASVIGTALYKLIVAYDLVQEAQAISDIGFLSTNDKAIICFQKRMPRYGPDEPNLPELNFRLMQLEMYSMFAKILATLKRNSPLSDVSWLDMPHGLEIAPAWHMTENSGEVSVRIRARVNENRLSRLIKRRWTHLLAYETKDEVSYNDFWRDNQLDTVWLEEQELKLKLSPMNEYFALRSKKITRNVWIKRRDLYRY